MPKFPQAFVTLRTCYKHPAGRLAVALAATLVDNGWVERAPSAQSPLGGYRLTGPGKEALANIGLDVDAITLTMLHKACSDYTQRLPDGTRGVAHIGGKLGAALTDWLLSGGLAQRLPQPHGVFEARTLVLTHEGIARLSAMGLLI